MRLGFIGSIFADENLPSPGTFRMFHSRPTVIRRAVALSNRIARSPCCVQIMNALQAKPAGRCMFNQPALRSGTSVGACARGDVAVVALAHEPGEAEQPQQADPAVVFVFIRALACG